MNSILDASKQNTATKLAQKPNCHVLSIIVSCQDKCGNMTLSSVDVTARKVQKNGLTDAIKERIGNERFDVEGIIAKNANGDCIGLASFGPYL